MFTEDEPKLQEAIAGFCIVFVLFILSAAWQSLFGY